MKRVVWFALLLAMLAAAGGAAFWWWSDRRLTEFARTPAGAPETKEVTIPPGSGPRRVADVLAQAGVVTDAELTYAWLRREKLGPKLRAGEYEFTLPLSPEQAIQKVIAGQQKTYHVTIPEGLRLDEILPLLASSPLKLRLDRLEALAADPAFGEEAGRARVPAGGLPLPRHLQLHPRVHRGERAREDGLADAGRAPAAEASKDPAVRLRDLEMVTLASIVEKETGAPDERPRIACLFLNRLRLGMPLQTDPTVLYAMMMIHGKFVKNISRQDLATAASVQHVHGEGAPAGADRQPGTAALQAVTHPAACSDLYFVSRNDGTHVFCPTLQCHNAAVKKWQVDYWAEQRRRARSGR